jgi:hypothetical protein
MASPMSRQLRFAFCGYVLALFCSVPIESYYLERTDGPILDRLIILCVWAGTACGLWLLVRRNIRAADLLAITTGFSMVFFHRNVGSLHKAGFIATLLLSIATIIRFISWLAIRSAKHDEWFSMSLSAIHMASAESTRIKGRPPMPVLQAAIGLLLGLGAMSVAGHVRWPNALLIGTGCLAAGAVLLGIFVWHYRKR